VLKPSEVQTLQGIFCGVYLHLENSSQAEIFAAELALVVQASACLRTHRNLNGPSARLKSALQTMPNIGGTPAAKPVCASLTALRMWPGLIG